ncbi:MAG: hypothetical protein ACYTF9_08180 [Planctomycetota bacterium]|jgi:hypothetical protein
MPNGPTTQAVESPAESARRNRRVKLAVMIVIFGPILLFTLFHLGRGIVKMTQGESIGYQQRDKRVGNAVD